MFSAITVGLALSACAGRDPQPIATVQVQDAYSDCTMIRAEIEGNNQKAKQLADGTMAWYQAHHIWSEETWGIYFDAARLDDLALGRSDLTYSGIFGSFIAQGKLRKGQNQATNFRSTSQAS